MKKCSFPISKVEGRNREGEKLEKDRKEMEAKKKSTQSWLIKWLDPIGIKKLLVYNPLFHFSLPLFHSISLFLSSRSFSSSYTIFCCFRRKSPFSSLFASPSLTILFSSHHFFLPTFCNPTKSIENMSLGSKEVQVEENFFLPLSLFYLQYFSEVFLPSFNVP